MALESWEPALVVALMLNQGLGHGKWRWTTRDIIRLTSVVAQLLLRSGLCQRLNVFPMVLILILILISALLLQVTVAWWQCVPVHAYNGALRFFSQMFSVLPTPEILDWEIKLLFANTEKRIKHNSRRRIVNEIWTRGKTLFKMLWYIFLIITAAISPSAIGQCNRTVGCNRTVTQANNFRSSPLNPSITTLIRSLL